MVKACEVMLEIIKVISGIAKSINVMVKIIKVMVKVITNIAKVEDIQTAKAIVKAVKDKAKVLNSSLSLTMFLNLRASPVSFT